MIAVLVLVGSTLLVGPVAAFDVAVMESVVRLKPNWSQAMRGAAPQDPQGTGVAVFTGGYIATNVHVIGDATEIDVLTQDGRTLMASVVGRHPPTDIALLKVAADLPVFKISEPPALAAPVCAIGNQFGLGLSVTCGVVSATGRSGTGFNPIEDFIQTDASVNPGGSGGALVDADGRLVGMVSAIFTKESDANIGVNFATSSKLLLRVARDLREYGAVKRPNLGLRAAAVPPPMNATTGGVMITWVDLEGPGFAAGLDAGDIVTHVDGRSVVDPSSFETALFMAAGATAIRFDVRRGEERRTVSLVLVP